MTVDDENSIYVGSLPYDATEDTLHRAFDYYGTIVAVKIINDQKVRGKCYGFVTFTNPRSAEAAIMEMDGKKIGGRVVRVNEVQTRGGRVDFGRDNFRRNAGRDRDWDRGSDRGRNYDRDRDHYRDRGNDRSRDRDRHRDYERGRFDQETDHAYDRDRDRDHEELDQDRTREREQNMDWDNDRDMDKSRSYDSARDREKEQPQRKRLGHLKGRDSREVSSSSSDDYHRDVKDRLEKSVQIHDELQKEVAQIKAKVEDKQQHILDLQQKYQKLEDALAAAQKVSSQRQSTATKLHRCFMQVQHDTDKVKISEKELQYLVDVGMAELEMCNNAVTKDGLVYANGQV